MLGPKKMNTPSNFFPPPSKSAWLWEAARPEHYIMIPLLKYVFEQIVPTSPCRSELDIHGPKNAAGPGGLFSSNQIYVPVKLLQSCYKIFLTVSYKDRVKPLPSCKAESCWSRKPTIPAHLPHIPSHTISSQIQINLYPFIFLVFTPLL